MPSGVPVPLIVNGQFWPACVAAPSYVIGMVAPPSFPVIVPATLRFSGHDIVNWPTAIVAVWVVIVSCMFEHCERLAGNPSALMRRLDTQVPISDEVDAVGPDAVGLDAVTSAGRLVGPRMFLSLFEPHADANAAAASRLSSGRVLFMVVI